jgi:hypothetical protein
MEGLLHIDTLTLVLSAVILLSPLFFRRTKRFSVGDIAGIATSLGIFGTFTGIFLGLLEFDVTDNRAAYRGC